MRRRTFGVVAVLVAAAAEAGDVVLGPGFSLGDLAELSAVVADAACFPQLAEAPPLGLAGVHVVAAAGGPRVSTRAAWWNAAMRERVVAGVLWAPRVLARKGLPKSWDVGAQVGRVFGYTFWGGEVARGVLDGGVLLPAVGVSAAVTRLQGAPFALSTGEARVTVSKGFTVVTAFASAGARWERASARVGDPLPRRYEVQERRGTAAAGVVVAVPPVRVVAEARRGAGSTVFLGLGVGL